MCPQEEKGSEEEDEEEGDKKEKKPLSCLDTPSKDPPKEAGSR
jgi:hypothetical protein